MARANPSHLERFLSPPPEPTPPNEKAQDVFERWLNNKVEQAKSLACPAALEELAVKNGKKLGMEVTILFTNEWQVRMKTARGTVCAAPMILEQTCRRCHGAHVIPHILDGGGEPCTACRGESVTLEQAWRRSLEELGLISS